jgi:Golgi phosphoprotein 3 (GPP34)
MDIPVSKLFIILALNPQKGRLAIDNINFRYTLTGALFMEYYEQEDFTTENMRIVPLFKKTGEVVHDLFASRIMNSKKNRKISFWIRRLTHKSRLIFREMINSMEKDNIIRTEHKKFLNIFPYKRYWLIDNRIRSNLIELLRGILLYGKKPGKNEIMLLGLVEASRAYRLLSHERGESKLLRKKNIEFLKGDLLSAEVSHVIREVHAAIITAVTAAAVAAHSSH